MNFDVFRKFAGVALAVHQFHLAQVVAVRFQVGPKCSCTPWVVLVKFGLLRFRAHHERGEFLVFVLFLDHGQIDGRVHPTFVFSNEVDKTIGFRLGVFALRFRHATALELGDVVHQVVASFAHLAGFVHERTNFLFVLGVLHFEGGERFSHFSLQSLLCVLQTVLHFHEAIQDLFGDVQGQKCGQDEVHHPNHLLTWCFFSSGHGLEA